MGKKKGKKGKGKKGKSSKYLDLEDGPMNHNGFVPNSQPMKIYLCEREKVIPEVEIPEKVKGEEKARLTRMQELERHGAPCLKISRASSYAWVITSIHTYLN